MNLPNQLVYVNNRKQGFKRERITKKHFQFLNISGDIIDDQVTLERINTLAIPPAWKEVWICPNENGHIQATGIDERNRLQYRYHTLWTDFRQAQKFDKIEHFGKFLPQLRAQINTDLQQTTFTYSKTLALAVKLLDCNYLRVGNDLYLNRNETYGLTTLRRKHLKEAEGKLLLSYQAKSGKQRNVKVNNQILINLLKKVNELPGYEVFRYKEGGKTMCIHSEDVNGYIQSINSNDFSAKDFRTWAGTKLCVEKLEDAKRLVASGKRQKLQTAVAALVAKQLGNTVATAKNYYIHPQLLEVISESPDRVGQMKLSEPEKQSLLSESEIITLRILEGL